MHKFCQWVAAMLPNRVVAVGQCGDTHCPMCWMENEIECLTAAYNSVCSEHEQQQEQCAALLTENRKLEKELKYYREHTGW